MTFSTSDSPMTLAVAECPGAPSRKASAFSTTKRHLIAGDNTTAFRMARRIMRLVLLVQISKVVAA